MELTLVRWPLEIVVRSARPAPKRDDEGARLERLYHQAQVQREALERIAQTRQSVFWRCFHSF